MIMASSKSGNPLQFLSEYNAYGFDIDHTLAKYHLPQLFNTFSKCLAQAMINRKPESYRVSLLREFDPDFCALRGLIFDIEKGNFFKVSNDGKVLHASHGTRFMDDAEIRKTFGQDRQWGRYGELLAKVDNLGKDEIRIFENFFDTPITMVAAHLVDYQDQERAADGSRPKEYTFYNDLKDSVKDLYCDFPDSLFFQEWVKETEKFVQPCSQDLKDWLRHLKEEGKVVFAVTSSVPLFMKESLKFILGEDWRTYFDVVIASSKKPKFFSEQKPFKRVNETLEAMEEQTTELNATDLFAEGNSKDLTRYIQKLLKIDDQPRVVYFGDSLRSDVFPVKKFTSWDVIMVLEEVVAEIHERCDNNDSSGTQPKEKKAREEENSGNSGYLTSKKWGSYFRDVCKDDQGKLAVAVTSDNMDNSSGSSSMNTLWGKVLHDNCGAVISSMEDVVKVVKGQAGIGGLFYPASPTVLQ